MIRNIVLQGVKRRGGKVCRADVDDKRVWKPARFSTDTEDQQQEERKMFGGYGNRTAQQRMQSISKGDKGGSREFNVAKQAQTCPPMAS